MMPLKDWADTYYSHDDFLEASLNPDLTLEAKLRPATEKEVKQHIYRNRRRQIEERWKKLRETTREDQLKASNEFALCPQCGNVTPVKDGEAIPQRRDGDGMWIPVGRCPHCKGIVWRKR